MTMNDSQVSKLSRLRSDPKANPYKLLKPSGSGMWPEKDNSLDTDAFRFLSGGAKAMGLHGLQGHTVCLTGWDMC